MLPGAPPRYRDTGEGRDRGARPICAMTAPRALPVGDFRAVPGIKALPTSLLGLRRHGCLGDRPRRMVPAVAPHLLDVHPRHQGHPTLTARDGPPPIRGVATVLPTGRRRVRPAIPHVRNPRTRHDAARARRWRSVGWSCPREQGVRQICGTTALSRSDRRFRSRSRPRDPPNGPFGPWRDRTPRSQRRRIPPAPASHFLDVRPRGTPGMENAANNGYTRNPRRGPASPRGVCPTGVTRGLSGRVTEEALGARGSRRPPIAARSNRKRAWTDGQDDRRGAGVIGRW